VSILQIFGISRKAKAFTCKLWCRAGGMACSGVYKLESVAALTHLIPLRLAARRPLA
jgi:hypothetical protein